MFFMHIIYELCIDEVQCTVYTCFRVSGRLTYMATCLNKSVRFIIVEAVSCIHNGYHPSYILIYEYMMC